MRRFTTKRNAITLLCTTLLALIWAWESAAAEDSAVFVRAVDGDTIEVAFQGQKEHVRLIGVDTPESSSNPKAVRDAQRTHEDLQSIIKMGKEAKYFLQRLIKPEDPLRLEFDVERRDRYHRMLAYVYLPDGRMLNELLVSQDYAQVFTVPPNVKYAALFRAKAAKARENGLGFWGRRSP